MMEGIKKLTDFFSQFDPETADYLYRIADITRLGNFQQDPLMVSADQVDLSPKEMFYVVRDRFELEYAPVSKNRTYDNDIDLDAAKEFADAFSLISTEGHLTTYIGAMLLKEKELANQRIRILTQFIEDNPLINESDFLNLAIALYDTNRVLKNIQNKYRNFH